MGNVGRKGGPSSPVHISGFSDDTGVPVRTLPDEFVDVFIQDQTTSPIQYYLMNELKDDITLTGPVAVGDQTISVSAGHGFTAGGEYIVIREGDAFLQSEVTAVAVNDITIKSPSDQAYSVAGSTVIRGDIEMDVNGSVTPVLYTFPIAGVTPLDVQTVLVNIHHATAGDDSLFGDIAALTNGLFFRKLNVGVFNLGNYSRNGDFREFGATIDYTDKAGAGNFSTVVTFDIKKVYGIVIRLDPRLNDSISSFVQDNLSALVRLRVSIMGQFTLGE